MNYLKFIRIFLFVLIVIGVGLLATQKIWVPKLVDRIISSDNVTLVAPEKINQLNSATTLSQKEKDILPGCKAAFAIESYPNHMKLSSEAKSAMQSYKLNWQALCLSKPNTSLYQVWVNLVELTNLREFQVGEWIDPSEPYTDEDMHYFSDVLPGFVPGLKGRFAEGYFEGYVPNVETFVQNVVLGDQEDKNFFTSYNGLNLGGTFEPWLVQTWDYGGCMDYGSYDWVKSLYTLDQLNFKVTKLKYMEIITSSKKYILNAVSAYHYDKYDLVPDKYDPTICTCEKKEAVLSDLDKVSQYIANIPSYKEMSNNINASINKIKNGETKIYSEAEQHCSGG